MVEASLEILALTRRQVVAGTAAAALNLTAARAAAQAQTQGGGFEPMASGTVFEDTTGSGKRSAASKGLSGVMVSNGRDIVTSGDDRSWALPVQDGDSIFVIKPSGWTTAVDPLTQLPRFATVYAPSNTPAHLDLRFQGLEPSPLPESIDFPLRQAEPDRSNAVLFTDPQPESLAEIGYVRDDVVAAAGGLDAAFGITHGDLMFRRPRPLRPLQRNRRHRGAAMDELLRQR